MIAFLCAHCGGFAYAEVESLDSGTTLVCDTCGKPTVVTLETPEELRERYAAQRSKR